LAAEYYLCVLGKEAIRVLNWMPYIFITNSILIAQLQTLHCLTISNCIFSENQLLLAVRL